MQFQRYVPLLTYHDVSSIDIPQITQWYFSLEREDMISYFSADMHHCVYLHGNSDYERLFIERTLMIPNHQSNFTSSIRFYLQVLEYYSNEPKYKEYAIHALAQHPDYDIYQLLSQYTNQEQLVHYITSKINIEYITLFSQLLKEMPSMAQYVSYEYFALVLYNVGTSLDKHHHSEFDILSAILHYHPEYAYSDFHRSAYNTNIILSTTCSFDFISYAYSII